jgi:hypothetical protein
VSIGEPWSGTRVTTRFRCLGFAGHSTRIGCMSASLFP